jgi:LPS export ABC transporter protein LptC
MIATRRIRRVLATTVVVASAAMAGAILLKQFRAAPPETPPRNLSPQTDMAMTKLRFSEMRDDAKLWELVAENADYDKDGGGKARLRLPRLEIYDKKAGGAVVTSETGQFLESSNQVIFQGKVHTVTKRGLVMDTEELVYHTKTGLLVTKKPVTVKDGRLTLKGVGMELASRNEEVRFTGRVEAVLEGKK